MSLGAAFALDEEQAAELLALGSDEAREEWLVELEEAVADGDWHQYDKWWDELHRCLGDGSLEIQDDPPRARAVLGSRPLMEDDETTMFAGFVPAGEIDAIAQALGELDEAWLRERVERLGIEGDFLEPLWTELGELRSFHAALAERRAAYLFTVDG